MPGKFSHVVIEGSHQILLPDVVANTPEVADDDSFMWVTGKFCVTPGCKCSLRKLEDLRSSRALPGQEAAAEQAGGAELLKFPRPWSPNSRTWILSESNRASKLCIRFPGIAGDAQFA